MPDKKLTDAEIVKALECCRDIDIKCETCQLWTVSECTKVLHQATIDLINRQKAEIERLKKNKYRLQKALSQSEDYRTIAKAEAIKEFAERLKQVFYNDEYILIRKIFDNLVKEMVGDTQ